MMTRTPGSRAIAALTFLFAALCCAGAFIPPFFVIGYVPFNFTNQIVVVSGLLLGPYWGSLSAITYLGIGVLGFPVFSGGRGGLAHLIGPTGGYLAGYVAAAFLAGFLGRRRGGIATALGAAFGFISILLLGAIGLKLANGVPWERAFVVGVLPFLPGDVGKTILAFAISRKLQPFVDSLIERDNVRA
jgi:biotin transport system substrate-specific component